MLYPDIKQIMEVYQKTIEVSGGGASGILKQGYIESIIEFIKNDDYYPTIEDKLAHLIFSINKSHCFQDGNKRMAISLGAQFLLLNGYVFIAGKFIREMENICYYVASGKISKEFLIEIIHSIIYEPEFSESLKLKIFTSING